MKNINYTIIKSIQQYDEYCELLEMLVTSNPDKNEDEIELLSLLIEDYNQKIMDNIRIELNPVELMEEIMRNYGLSQIELSKRLEVSPQLVSDILKYRREITKKFAYKISDEFKMNFSAFLKPYNLRVAS